VYACVCEREEYCNRCICVAKFDVCVSVCTLTCVAVCFMCCSVFRVLQCVSCVAVCSSVLQGLALCCNRSVCVSVCTQTLVAVCCSVLQRVAVCCSVQQYVTGYCSVLHSIRLGVCVHAHVCCSVLAVYCSVLQCATVCYSVLQCVDGKKRPGSSQKGVHASNATPRGRIGTTLLDLSLRNCYDRYLYIHIRV